MAKVLSNAVTWIVVLLLAILVLLAGIVLGWWGDGRGEPSPSPTQVTSNASPTPEPAFVDRPVSTGEHLPDAAPLSQVVLASAGSGWVVAIHDSTQIDTSDPSLPRTPGPRVLYLVSPSGNRYEVANLDLLGFGAPDLVAWDEARDLLLLSEGGTGLRVVDMSTGGILSSWSACTGEGGVRSGEARGNAWLVRGNCEGDGFDGLYTDSGSLLSSRIVGAEPFLTVVDIGEVQVTWEWEGTVEEKFVAVRPDGTETPLPWMEAGDCYPLAKGRGDAVAMTCYSETGRLSLWELPVDGSAPAQAVTSDQLDEFAAAEGGYGPEEYWVSGYCSDSALKVVQFSLGMGDDVTQRLGVLYGGTVEAVGQVPFAYRVCHAAEGTSALVSGDGHLWWVDFDTGEDIEMLPGESAGSPVQVVGSDGYRAIRLP